MERRAMVVAVKTAGVSDGDFNRALAELHQLARALGMDVVDTVAEKRTSFDPIVYLGKSTLEEVRLLVGSGEHRACEVLLVEHALTPSQARNLAAACCCTVLDRTQAIVELFQRQSPANAARATRAELEVVRAQRMAPRRGGLAERRPRRAGRNKRAKLARATLIGHTGAGKSTLMRALTGQLAAVPHVVLSESLGFIRDLPYGLVGLFKSTIDEAVDASLLIHVVDASDPAFAQQLRMIDSVLDQVGAGDTPRLVVFTKIDRAFSEPAARRLILERWPYSPMVNAHSSDDVRRLGAVVIEHFSGDLQKQRRFA